MTMLGPGERRAVFFTTGTVVVGDTGETRRVTVARVVTIVGGRAVWMQDGAVIDATDDPARVAWARSFIDSACGLPVEAEQGC